MQFLFRLDLAFAPSNAALEDVWKQCRHLRLCVLSLPSPPLPGPPVPFSVPFAMAGAWNRFLSAARCSDNLLC